MRIVIAFIVVLATGETSFAQMGVGTEAEAKASKAATTAAAPANLSFATVPGATGRDALSAVQVILDASTKDKVGTAAFGWTTGKQQVQLAFSAPVGTSGEATPISLTGLTNAAKAKLSVSHLFWRTPNPVEQAQLVALCERLGMLPKPSGPNGQYTPEDFKLAQDMTPCRTSTIVNPNDRAMYEFLSHAKARPWMVGFEGAVGQVTNRFVEKDTLVSATDKELDWTVAGRLGVYQQGMGFFLLTYNYVETTSAAGPPTQVCRPMSDVTVAGALRCDSVVIGGPTSKTTSVITGEMRQMVSGKLAFSPSVMFDLKKNAENKQVWAVEVPVYFLMTTGTASPTGGVRFGWRSDNKEVTAVIFIGGAFKLFG